MHFSPPLSVGEGAGGEVKVKNFTYICAIATAGGEYLDWH